VRIIFGAVLAIFLGTVEANCGPEPRGAEAAADLDIAEVLHLPTPHPVVEAMLQLAGVRPGDVVYDLGSGDGRIPIAAARRYGVRGVGVELDRRFVEQARCRAREAGVEHLVEFRQADIFETDLRQATVVTLFLFPQTNARLLSKLRAELPAGARVVSHRFGVGDWQPEREVEAHGHPLLLWRITR
jgi:cyclopropane fatty-acyl-phospholipid synthase-like methyltransferase